MDSASRTRHRWDHSFDTSGERGEGEGGEEGEMERGEKDADLHSTPSYNKQKTSFISLLRRHSIGNYMYMQHCYNIIKTNTYMYTVTDIPYKELLHSWILYLYVCITWLDADPTMCFFAVVTFIMAMLVCTIWVIQGVFTHIVIVTPNETVMAAYEVDSIITANIVHRVTSTTQVEDEENQEIYVLSREVWWHPLLFKCQAWC